MNKGIFFVNDLIDENGNIYTKQDRTCTFCCVYAFLLPFSSQLKLSFHIVGHTYPGGCGLALQQDKHQSWDANIANLTRTSECHLGGLQPFTDCEALGCLIGPEIHYHYPTAAEGHRGATQFQNCKDRLLSYKDKQMQRSHIGPLTLMTKCQPP